MEISALAMMEKRIVQRKKAEFELETKPHNVYLSKILSSVKTWM